MSQDLQAVIDAGAALVKVQVFEGVPVIVTPEGYNVHELDHLLPAPARKKGNATLFDLESFISLVNQEKNASTRIYGTSVPPDFTAVFNDHGTEPGFKDHTARYSCPLSVEWQRWVNSSGKRFTQEEFATFIEDNARDIVTPAAADMLEISRTLYAKKNVAFASGIRLENGENQLKYEEKIEGSAGKLGELKIPEVFTIAVPFTVGGPQYGLKARLRYRIDGSNLKMWYDLDATHKVIEDAVKELFGFIEQGVGIKPLHGKAT